MKAISYKELCEKCLESMVLDEYGTVIDNGGQEAIDKRKELMDSLITRIRFIDQFEPLYQTYTFGLNFRLENKDRSIKPIPRISVLKNHTYKMVDLDLVPLVIVNHYTVLRAKIEQWEQGHILLLNQALPPGFEEYQYVATSTES